MRTKTNARHQRFLATLTTVIVLPFIAGISNAGNIVSEAPETKRIWIPRELLSDAPEEFRNQFLPRIPPPNPITKSAGHYSANGWGNAIDSIWGPGPPMSTKVARFDYFWNTIDDKYACFQDLDANWDSIWNRYSPEINNTAVSRGRFAAIMNHATRALQEGHTQAWDSVVYFTRLEPGVPLMYVGGWGANDHFGAGLTPLPDSSLLVYKAVADHPLGLVPGDIVLGYDGIPWKVLYPQLLKVELPVTGFWWGSSESSHTHAWLMAAGLNWHLFDTIDIVKYDTGDTVHLATNGLVGQDMPLFATEQMDIPGVPMPDISSRHLTSWGIIEGTRIGYIYCWGWFWENSETEWLDAISSLMSGTTGLIIDFRTNYGGYLPAVLPGLQLLFKDTLDIARVAWRSNPDDHLSMEPSPMLPDNFFTIYGYPSTYYDKPIALLIGPGCISAGDYTSLALTYHPMTKLFGKPTTASFNSAEPIDWGPDFRFRYARLEMYLLSNPEHYLTHDEFPNPVDFPWVSYQNVWLTPDGVAQGKDDVVDAAIAWINSVTDVHDEPEGKLPKEFTLGQNFPNPFNSSTVISYRLPSRSRVALTVYNVWGEQVTELMNETKPAGDFHIAWDGKDLRGEPVASGVYLYQLQAGGCTITKKMLLLK